MVYSYEDKLEALRDRCHRSLDTLLVLIDRFREFKEAQAPRTPELSERLDNIYQKISFFKEYYFLLSRAFILGTVEERNDLGRKFDAIPESERNRIDFAKFSRENFDAIDQFLTSFVRLKLELLMDEMAPDRNYPLDEAKKDLIYLVG